MSCPICDQTLTITELQCPDCKIQMQGIFSLPRLARLERDQLLLAEQLILAGGNLKGLAEQLDTSYPTLRKRLDHLIDALLQLKLDDERQTQEWLDAVEQGRMSAEEASRRIEELTFGR
ncbi:MAG: DUF2089 domain-containing protein [Ketobacter sp.]|nr:DUF2089 domain-containing protein [Ketobacter sp.]